MESTRRILIVDDEPAIRNLLAVVFASAGYKVRMASDGAEAMLICESESFNVLLSDVKMPGMNGHELARWVVTRYPETRAVLMSGYDDIKCVGCGVPARPCSLLAKPFNPKHAVTLVNELLDRTATPLFSISVVR